MKLVAQARGSNMCACNRLKKPGQAQTIGDPFTRDAATQKPRGFQPIPGKKPVPFPYKSDKAVSWKYAPQKFDRRKDKSVIDDPSVIP